MIRKWFKNMKPSSVSIQNMISQPTISDTKTSNVWGEIQWCYIIIKLLKFLDRGFHLFVAVWIWEKEKFTYIIITHCCKSAQVYLRQTGTHCSHCQSNYIDKISSWIWPRNCPIMNKQFAQKLKKRIMNSQPQQHREIKRQT